MPAGAQRVWSTPRSAYAATSALDSVTSADAQLRMHLPARLNDGRDLPRFDAARARRSAPVWAPVASLLVPGAGQLAMGQTRGVAYLAAETYAVLQRLEAARTARARRSDYHRLAFEVARRRFGGVAEGPWSYYEAIYDFPASGMYNRTPGATLTPESDATTFNGAQWLKARELYWEDPTVAPPPSDARYQRAIDFYQKSAWGDGYLWTFEDQLLKWEEYKSTIVRENQATREMTATAGVVLANHLLSAIDALATVRLRRTSTAAGPGQTRIEATVPWPWRRTARPR